MPSERIAMRQVRDIVRLKSAGVALREIARRIGVVKEGKWEPCSAILASNRKRLADCNK